MVLTKRQKLYMSLLLFLYLYVCRSFTVVPITGLMTSVITLHFVRYWRLISHFICLSFETTNTCNFFVFNLNAEFYYAVRLPYFGDSF